ncbi:MAG TPA: hypothetical protein VGL77_21180, partial [Armatimonadota bacterium]
MSLSHNQESSNPGNDDPWDLLIGAISAPRGLKGEMRVYPHTDFPDRFTELKTVGLRREGTWLGTRAVTSAQIIGTRIVVKLA